MEKVLAEEDCGPTKMRVEQGVYVFDYWVDQETTKKKAKQVRETDGRPSCKPGSCGRSGDGGVWGPRRFGGGPRRTHGGTKAESCKSVATPTTQELEEHQATAHAVHRSWCGHCMRAWATAARHQTVSHDEESEVPVRSFDYIRLLVLRRKGRRHSELRSEGL